jgi:crossover junction endodeoxyribonuclease RuvC
MIILGIDPGTNRTGWGVIRKSKKEEISYIAHGCIITEKIKSMPDRLLTLHASINTLIKEHEPSCVIVENIFFGRNVKTAMTVSQAKGVVMLSSAIYELPVFEYTPNTVKLTLTGNGRTEKKGVQAAVRRLLRTNRRKLAFNGKESKDFDDSADALAIALHHAIKLDDLR